jgi:ADP-heptose:LPS heptosyltransferase
MIKSHSVGIGDILRSSAAWRAMKNRWPGVELHLLFLSRHEGYPSEDLIRQHHLLGSSTFLIIRHGVPHGDQVRKVSNLKIAKQVWQLAKRLKPDLIIDFEWAGMRTSLVSLVARLASGAPSVGIAQFPFRSRFYTYKSSSSLDYASRFGLGDPFDYTLRDFVVLQAFGINRDNVPIELEVTLYAKNQLKKILPPCKAKLRVGLNIGCATFGAAHKRMPINKLATYLIALMKLHDVEIILSGAPDEETINKCFLEEFAIQGGNLDRIHDLSGRTNMSTLTALIDACDIFVSTDSGPYHMAVALKKPTLCWFTAFGMGSLHPHKWVESLVNPTEFEFLSSFEKLYLLAKSSIIEN